MATKRPAPHVHPSRQEQVPQEPRRKRQKPDTAGPKSFKKAHPVNELKSRIRNLKRLLERNDNLPANVRVEKERELQSVQQELAESQRAKQRSDIIGRYHKVRFFDRQKATKRLKRAKKELRACEDVGEVREELARRVDDAEVDVNYAQYFPLEQHYVSLFPRKKEGEEEDGDVERKGDPEMWRTVKECMANGTLDALRNGRLKGVEEKQEEEQESRPSGTSKKKRKRGVRDDGDAGAVEVGSDDETGGGFFE